MSPPSGGVFAARVSVLANLVVVACFLPVVVAVAANLVLHPAAPVWVRIAGGVLILPVLVYAAVALRLCTMSHPVIDIDGRGLLWRRWSDTRIPWSAMARWSARGTMGQHYVTIWLHDRTAHPCTGLNGWLAIGNRRLGYGDLTLSTAGTDGRLEDMTAAIRANLGPPSGGGPGDEPTETARRAGR